MSSGASLEMFASNCPAILAWQRRKQEVRERFRGSACQIAESDRRIDDEIEQVRASAKRIGCASLAKQLPGTDALVPPALTEEWHEFVRACPAYVALKQNKSNQQEN